MIEIVMDKERNLKNLKQIGSPKDEDKIYMENLAYSKIKEESYKDKRIFVLMGHSECSQGRYATFVEAAIPVKDVEFVGNIPRMTNTMWGEVFREIRRLYEDMIIVGWAVDIKGMPPKMTAELERVHREHFGGVHQLLFLLNSIEHEESFYVYKENRLVSKDGFYIYYRAHRKIEEKTQREIIPIKQNFSEAPVKVDIDVSEETLSNGGRYRQMVKEQTTERKTESGNLGVAIAAAMLFFVIGVGAYESRDTLFQKPESVETNVIQEDKALKETPASGEEVIPVEIISGTEEETQKEE